MTQTEPNHANDNIDHGGSAESLSPILDKTEQLFIHNTYQFQDNITEIINIRRGNPGSDKFVIRTPNDIYLLKRRIAQNADIKQIEFIHNLCTHLSRCKYPVPELIAAPSTTTTTHTPHSVNNTLIENSPYTYELMRYAHGRPYIRNNPDSRQAGKYLAALHVLLAQLHDLPAIPDRGSFHNQTDLTIKTEHFLQHHCKKLHQIHDMKKNLRYMLDRYKNACTMVNHHGYADWPLMVVHGDWHPGNLIFNNNTNEVAAVFDFDSTGLNPRAVDIANGALHFSIQAHGNDPTHWPAHPDELRWYSFCNGYDDYAELYMLSKAEVRAMPWLMIEALISESLTSLAATGKVGNIPALPFLNMVVRKINWLADNADRMIRILGGG